MFDIPKKRLFAIVIVCLAITGTISVINSLRLDEQRKNERHVQETTLALAQNAISQLDVTNGANLYRQGKYEEALAIFREAAEKGNADALFNMGWAYYFGHGVEQDYQTSAEWFQKAADAGSAFAWNSLGRIYFDGNGVEKDLAKALVFYLRGAKMDDGEAAFNAAYMYYNGMGTEIDEAEALKWFKRAKELGIGEADSYIKELSAS